MVIKKAQTGKKVGAEGRNRGSVAVGGNLKLDDKPRMAPSKVKKQSNPADSYPANKDKRGIPTIGGGEGKLPPFPNGRKGTPMVKPTLGGAKNGKSMKKAKSGSKMKTCKDGC